MRRRWLITLILIPLTLWLTGWMAYCYHTVPEQECSDLYRRYAADPHIEVAFIRDFPVNDTLALDVTTLKALDTIGWDSLMQYFGLPATLIELYNDTLRNLELPANIHFRIDKDDPSKRPPPDSGPTPSVIANIKEQVFSIYYIEDVSQFEAVLGFESQKLKKQ